MDIQGFFTKKGLLLAAKLAAGSTLKITRVCAGAAETALTASALSQIRQTLSAGAARRNGDTAVLPVTLVAGMAGSAYALRELGIYAQDPDEGEILYKVYRLSEPVEIRPSSRLVLRFYLEETVSQDLNVTVVRASAGLLTEADLEPLRSRVESRSVPARTVEVAAAELPAFITSLPRLVTESLTIKVTSGTVPGNVAVSRFYGPGSLSIAAEDGAEVVLSHAMSISSCQIGVGLTGLKFLNANSAEVILTISGSHAVMSNCVIDGNHLISYNYGCLARDGGSVYAINCDITNCQYALGAQSAGIVSALNCTGSGNKVGCYVSYGGMAFLSGTTPDLMGGTANRKESGLIVKSNGTLV